MTNLFKRGGAFKSLLAFLDFFFMCLGDLPECVCAPCACSALGGWKGASGTVELEL